MKNWIWMHPRPGEEPEEWKREFEQYRKAGIDAALVCVYHGRETLYGSGLLPVTCDLLEQLLPLAREAGVEVHAWIVSLRCNLPELQKAHPDWFSVSRNGDSSLEKPPYIPSYQWLCPSHPEVRAFLGRIAKELAAYDGVAGVHLDYIRHPDVILPAQLQLKYGLVQDREFPEYDFCYCPVCRRAFREREGRDPLEMEDPPSDPAWRAFRWESVQGAVAEAARQVRDRSKLLTAAVFATPRLARKFVRQDWPRWDLDAVMPMIYHYYYEEPPSWVGEATREGVGEIQGRFPLYSGLFIPRLSPEDLRNVIGDSLAGGADGITLFSSGSMTPEHWRAVEEVLKP